MYEVIKTVPSNCSRRETLLELADFISTSRNVLNEHIYPEVVRMVGNNLFRVLPPADTPDYDPEEDEPSLESAWPHLQVTFHLEHSILLLCERSWCCDVDRL